MLVNSKDLGGNFEIVADICIVGSGPAGIAIAMEYDGLPIRVAVLEAGGDETEAAHASRDRLASDSRFGDFFLDLPGRQVGGNANLWNINAPGAAHGLRLLPLREVDFEPRNWIPETGWPVSLSYFEGYYKRALAFLKLPERGFDPEDWAEPDTAPLPLKSTRLRTGMFQFASGEIISKQHRDQLIASKNVTLYSNASVVEIRTDDADKKVTGLKIASAAGHQINARADQFILAAGALWTTQLLLASGKKPGEGLGNAGGHLGRHLSVHPLLLGGRFYPSSADLYEKMKLYDMRAVDGVAVMGHLQLTEEAIRSEPLLGLSTLLFAVERGARPKLSRRQKRGCDAASRIREARKAGLSPHAGDVLRALAGIDGVLLRLIARARHRIWNFDNGGWSALPDQRTHFDGFEVFHITEQMPSSENYVYLSDERDAFGARKLGIRWVYSADDVAAIQRAQGVIKEDLGKAGLGEFEISREPDGGPTLVSSHANHFFGLTRMSADPKDGVVDTDCRVHGMDNLYLASSSVFPTGGFANPTLTIIALAHRVADSALADWLQAHPEAGAAVAIADRSSRYRRRAPGAVG